MAKIKKMTPEERAQQEANQRRLQELIDRLAARRQADDQELRRASS
jgi:hypothetical protein